MKIVPRDKKNIVMYSLSSPCNFASFHLLYITNLPAMQNFLLHILFIVGSNADDGF